MRVDVDVTMQESNLTSTTSVQATKKDTTVGQTLTQMQIVAGFHIPEECYPPLKKPCRETNPAMKGLGQTQELITKEHNHFWNMNRRRLLREICDRVYVAGLISGVVLSFITIFWYRYFSSVLNVYGVLVFNNHTKSHEKMQIASPFIEDIQHGPWAFVSFMNGTLFLAQANIFTTYAKRANYKLRSFIYIIALFSLLISFLYIVTAPIWAFYLAGNSDAEIVTLKHDEYVAYKRGYKGTFNYYHDNQCGQKSGSLLKNKDSSTRAKMDFFCLMLWRLSIFLYFMWVTAVIPLLAFVCSCLDFIVNHKEWSIKTMRKFKPRTKEQIQDDRSKGGD